MASPKNGIVVSIETATPLWALLSVSDIMISIVTVCLMTPRSDELRTNRAQRATDDRSGERVLVTRVSVAEWQKGHQCSGKPRLASTKPSPLRGATVRQLFARPKTRPSRA